MKKLFRTLAIAIIALTAVFACAFTAGCVDKDKSTTSDYNFTIVDENGKAINGQTDGQNGGKVMTQICIDDICIPLAMQNIYPDKNGKVNLSQTQINTLFANAMTVTGDVTEFVFHVINFPGYAPDCEVAVKGKGNYTVHLEK